MRALVYLRLLINFLGIFSLAMAAPLIAAVLEKDPVMVFSFGLPLASAQALSLPVFFLFRRRSFDIRASEGIFLAALAWIAGGLFAAAPYFLSGYMPRFSDAVFESVSGLTTTGATIIPDVEILPRSFHLWRGMTHWLGGLGIVVLTVALAPMLGVGGFRLLKAETGGPVKEKFTPRVAATAKILWLMYLGLTALQTALLAAGGMGLFEALIHAFSTMGTGGFSTRNGGIADFNSPWVEWVCTAFMLIAGFNFTLVYRLLRGRFREVAVNSEARAYGLVAGVSALVIALALLPSGAASRRALFHAASFLTTTGFLAEDYNLWPPLAQMVLFLLLFCGGCSGSTAGGVKVVRYVILGKQMRNEIRRTLYPSGLFSVQLDRKPGRKDVVYSAAGFIALYFLALLAGTVLAASAGLGLFASVNAAALCLGNVGLGLGELVSGSVFTAAPEYLKWGLSLLMIVGRLELFTVILIFLPAYWRRQGGR